MRRGWFSKQNGLGAQSRSNLIWRTAEARRTSTNTLTNKVMRPRYRLASQFPQSRVSPGEIARRIEPCGIFPCNFNKFVSIGSGPPRLIRLFQPASGCTEWHRRKELPWSGHSASRGGCTPDAAGWLQSQTGQKFPTSDRGAGRIITFDSKRLCAATHAFIASPMHTLRFLVQGSRVQASQTLEPDGRSS